MKHSNKKSIGIAKHRAVFLVVSAAKFLRILSKNKIGMLGLVILLFFIVLGSIGPLIIPRPTSNPTAIYLPPSLEHPFGTDFEGKDVFAQIVHGTPIVLQIAFLTGFLTVIISFTLGALSGYRGGLVDSIIMFISDVILTIPFIPLFMVLATVVKFNEARIIALLLAVFSWPPIARAIRSQVLALRETTFIEAARIIGYSSIEIVFREILPNIAAFIAVSFIFASINAIYAQVGLAFLGIIPYIGENWGIMINRAYTYGAIFYSKSFWYNMAPIIMIILLQLGLLLFSRLLEDFLNPRVRVGE
ncbi:ABC transporter permease [Ignisphaera sp. 4213-co]|uniref:ABC transporter permease n=1 Tax=Ignisphaera cupida TaxID=3050454 RepID=A0ABD4Z5D5_9CREN|nr:ABC transporter permease [Ignisphaera sp. 4213-co]MDK6028110.1 ABC transporter permease [Ignisphaera sp. 4213-co]